MAVRFGIIGCGAIFGTHADALKGVEGAEFTAVFDLDKAKAKAAADRYGVIAAPSLSKFFDHVDAVAICTPSGYHSGVGIKAIKAGKHVVVEKPIDITYRAANALVTAAKDAGVKLGCISQHRFSSGVRRLRDAAQSGDLGRLIQGDATIKWYRTQAYYDSGDWRGTWKLDGGGCLMNQGVHYVDMIQWIMGGVRSVQAVCRTLAHNIEVEDVATALVEYQNGAIGVIQGSTCVYPGLAERLEVHGTHGTVILEQDRPKLWKVDPEMAQKGKYGDGVMMQPTPSQHLVGTDISATSELDEATAQWNAQHRLQLQDFTQAILDDREPFMTGEMALEPLKVILAIYRSSQRNGARITINQ